MLNQGKKKKRRAAKGKWKAWYKKEPQNNFILSVALCGPFSFNSHTFTICICTCVCVSVGERVFALSLQLSSGFLAPV